MGMPGFGSSSTYDSKSVAATIVERIVVERPVVVNVARKPCPYPKLPNPDPWNWYKVRFCCTMRQNKPVWLLIEVVYPDCKNYEGRKILLYRGCNYWDLRDQQHLDPHFSRNKKYHTPFARFEPTEAGWQAGLALMNHLE